MGKSKSKKNPKQVVIDTPKSDVDSEDSEEVDGDDADENDENDEITEETLTEEQGEELQVYLRSATAVMGRLNATKKDFVTKQFLDVLNAQRAAVAQSSGMAGERSDDDAEEDDLKNVVPDVVRKQHRKSGHGKERAAKKRKINHSAMAQKAAGLNELSSDDDEVSTVPATTAGLSSDALLKLVLNLQSQISSSPIAAVPATPAISSVNITSLGK